MTGAQKNISTWVKEATPTEKEGNQETWPMYTWRIREQF